MCPTGKVGHPSKSAAKAAATAVGRTRTHDRPRVYLCACGRWHMTTAVKQRTPPAQRTRRRRGPALPPPQIATRKELDAWFEQHSQR